MQSCALTVGSISLASVNPALPPSLVIAGKMTLADSWMHFAPQLAAGALAARAFKTTQ
jgi:glycerol uptake facilitator-like aquaporin